MIAPLAQAFALQDANEAAARRLFELTDAAPAVAECQVVPDHGRGGRRRPDPPAIEIRGLRFRYAPDEPWVLDGLDLCIPPGGSLALVGPSGSGKSTLVNLLLRFWDYEAGSIRIGGRELRGYPRRRGPGDARRRPAGDPPLQRDDPRQPRRGRRGRDRRADRRRLPAWRRSTTSSRRCPAGYETRVGEHGLLLSGGERQRLAIARAILKDAPILVLDEATANLDVLTERDLMTSLAPFMAGRTTLVISHRASVAAGMDRMVRLDGQPGEASSAGSRSPASIRIGSRFSAGVSGHE